jgi:hypothetical protein
MKLNKLFYLCTFVSFTCLAANGLEAKTNTFTDEQIRSCGLAQLNANKCIKEGKEATTGLFGGLVSKITDSDMGKTAANKGAGQTANLICSKEIEEADKKCLAPK